MMYVNQAIMLYALNLYIDVCQLFLNKAGKKTCWWSVKEWSVLMSSSSFEMHQKMHRCVDRGMDTYVIKQIEQKC